MKMSLTEAIIFDQGHLCFQIIYKINWLKSLFFTM